MEGLALAVLIIFSLIGLAAVFFTTFGTLIILIGGILGAVLGAGFLGIGLLLGTFLGIFLGAFLVELLIQRDFIKSLKSGAGGVIGRIGSIIAKLAIAVIMLAIMASRIIKI